MLRAALTSQEDSAFEVEALAAYGARQIHFLWQLSGSRSADDLVTAVRERKGLVLGHDVAERICAYAKTYDGPVFTAAEGIERLARFDLLDWASRQLFVTGSAANIRERVSRLLDAGAQAFQIASVGYRDPDERSDHLTGVVKALTQRNVG